VQVKALVEAPDDVTAFDGPVGVGAHQEPGVVVLDVEDLDRAPVGELPVRRIGLPPLVGLVRLEPRERALRSLLGLRRDEPPVPEDPPDRGRCRGPAVSTLEVEGDRVSPGVESLFAELLSDQDDLVLDLPTRALRNAFGPSRPGLKPGLALGVEPTDELVHPPPGDSVPPGDLGPRPPLEPDPSHDQPSQRHAPPPPIEV
jgi:hypothetical protein